jgi:hypothetical protein
MNLRAKLNRLGNPFRVPECWCREREPRPADLRAFLALPADRRNQLLDTHWACCVHKDCYLRALRAEVQALSDEELLALVREADGSDSIP